MAGMRSVKLGCAYVCAAMAVCAGCKSNGGGSGGDADTSTSLTITDTSPSTTDTTSATESQSGTMGTETGPTTTGDDETEGTKFDLPVSPDVGSRGCGDGGGDIEFSYIWIANSGQNTISKINTETIVEEGRYYVRPDEAGNPSRTSVNLSGDVAVASRSGGITKLFARTDDCQDTNGMAGIQTSGGAMDILPWGTEECAAWHRPLVLSTNRPVAWTSGTLNEGTCEYEDQFVWTAGAQVGQDGTTEVFRLRGDDGSIDAMLSVPEMQVGTYGPYGGAVDGSNDFWFINKMYGSKIVRVRFDDLTYQVWDNPPNMWTYGFTVDSKGRPWIGGFQDGVARFDPMSETWTVEPSVTGFGIQEDADGFMWVATPPSVGPGVHSIDSDTMMPGDYVSLPMGFFTKGVSIDFFGYVWVVDQTQYAFKVDRQTLTYDVYDGLTSAYTYSDMTGWGLNNVVNPPG